jgi:hypothetical protein
MPVFANFDRSIASVDGRLPLHASLIFLFVSSDNLQFKAPSLPQE